MHALREFGQIHGQPGPGYLFAAHVIPARSPRPSTSSDWPPRSSASSGWDVHSDFHRAAEVARAAYDAGLAALRPGRTFGELVDAIHEPIEEADGWPFLIAVHSLNPGLSVGKGLGTFSRIPGAGGYPRVPDHPTFLPDLELVPGMSFAFEPNYAFGRHLVHLGGTVVVGQDSPIELNPYSAQLLHTAGN
ncbi:M24 family metallopeptidase [Nocardia macrotermitis]|uniref:Peptidase M24 domain-containing protein n=1 Tax=Nocardia macrotermitis TaxID=2585198 RepID=A0A7K0DF62_9NOCA|nr:M24 family metallopeptidase [Nocardia macrotermitis]MQY24426.1 hypothetical protein [Nocardia macrotermitis]